MQEIALFLSSIAGACTAAAVKKFPKNKTVAPTIGANSQIKNQINSLRLEKEILTKTITRLYQNDAGLNKIQRDQLLLRYQHQLGIILAKIEKLEMASKHPDLGPVGEGLITLMDQKLSQLDKRLYELSSKITIANTQTSEVKPELREKDQVRKEKQIVKPQEKSFVEKRVEEKPQPKVIIPKIQAMPQIPRSVELTTLTDLSNKHIEFPLIEQKPVQPKTEENTLKPQEKIPEKVEMVQAPLKSEIKPDIVKQEIQSKPQTQEAITKIEPEKSETASKLLDEDKIEEDEDDLDKIKGEIMKTLSRLEQAEVE